jgi:hypothetical protein
MADKRRITAEISSGAAWAFDQSQARDLLILLVVPAGIEPATFRV